MDRWDMMTLAGLICLGVGLWLIHPPTALVVIGAMVMVLGWVGSAAAAQARRSTKVEED